MAKATCSATVTRGPDSWAYFYNVLIFAVAIEGVFIALAAERLGFVLSALVFAFVAGLTTFGVLFSGWVQNKLIGLKSRYENQPR